MIPGSSKKNNHIGINKYYCSTPCTPQLNVEVHDNGKPLLLLKWLFFLKAVVDTGCAQHQCRGSGARKNLHRTLCAWVSGDFFVEELYFSHIFFDGTPLPNCMTMYALQFATCHPPVN